MGHQDFFKLKKNHNSVTSQFWISKLLQRKFQRYLSWGVGGEGGFFLLGKVRNNLSLGSLKSVLLLFLELNLIIELQL